MTDIRDDFCGQTQPHSDHPWNPWFPPGTIYVGGPKQCGGHRPEVEGAFVPPRELLIESIEGTRAFRVTHDLCDSLILDTQYVHVDTLLRLTCRSCALEPQT